MESIKKFVKKSLSTQKGRTTAAAMVVIPTTTFIGGTFGFWKAVGETSFALTAPVSYPLTGYAIGKCMEMGVKEMGEEDPVFEKMSNVPFAKTIGFSHALLIPLAPLKAATAWTAIPKGLVTGFAAGVSGTWAFHEAQVLDPEAAQEEVDSYVDTVVDFVDSIKNAA